MKGHVDFGPQMLEILIIARNIIVISTKRGTEKHLRVPIEH